MTEVKLDGLGSLARRFTRVLVHPAAEMSPPLEGERFYRFCQMLQSFGDVDEVDPIVAVRWPEADGHVNGSIAILSGRTRLEACRRLGLDAKIRLYAGGQSPVELAASLNYFHQHPTSGQLAAMGVELEDLIAEEAKKRQKGAGGDRKSLLSKMTKAIPGQESENSATTPLHSRKLIADMLEVSEGYIWQARKIRETDVDLFRQLKSRTLTLAQARSKLCANARRLKPIPDGPLDKPRDKNGLTGVRHGDCLKILPLLPRRKFRLLFTDPPYNIGIDYGDGSKADQLQPAEYLRRMESWIGMLPDLLTPDGTAWVMISNEWAAEFVMAMKRTGMKMRGWIKWYETFGVNCSNNFNRTSRHLLYFVRDPKRFVFNPSAFSRPSARQEKYGDKRANPAGKLWDDVWQIPRLTGTCAERIPDFPTQLPLALVKPIIEGCSEPGDLIIDPFSGSGTTAAACAMSGRQCLGIEVSAQYAALSRARLHAIGAKP